MTKPLTIGVLALQGAFSEHIEYLREADNEINCIEVRGKEDLQICDALVIPGGESTSMSLIAERTGLLNPLQDFIKSEKPVWGTCAGLIFLSKQVSNGSKGQKLLGGMDIRVQRNAFGRQLDSFEQTLDFSSFIPGIDQFPTVFIRAPVVETILNKNSVTDTNSISLTNLQLDSASNIKTNSTPTIIESTNTYINSAKVEILHQLDNGFIVAVRQGNKLGTSFHPELSGDIRFHRWFIQEFVKCNAKIP